MLLDRIEHIFWPILYWLVLTLIKVVITVMVTVLYLQSWYHCIVTLVLSMWMRWLIAMYSRYSSHYDIRHTMIFVTPWYSSHHDICHTMIFVTPSFDLQCIFVDNHFLRETWNSNYYQYTRITSTMPWWSFTNFILSTAYSSILQTFTQIHGYMYFYIFPSRLIRQCFIHQRTHLSDCPRITKTGTDYIPARRRLRASWGGTRHFWCCRDGRAKTINKED